MASPELRIYRDGQRGRRLPVRLYRGPLGAPLVLFSPGFGGSCADYAGLARAWQAGGLSVAVLEHPGSARLQALGLLPWRLLRSPQQLRGRAHTPQECRHRPLDALFLLDCLTRELNPRALGMAGHSFGSYTALAVAGLPVRGVRYGDPRVQAVVALSPHPPGWLFEARDYPELERPCLMITGTRDRPLEGRRQAFQALRCPAELLVIEGAAHMDLAGWGPPRVVSEAAQAGLKFWRRWLG